MISRSGVVLLLALAGLLLFVGTAGGHSEVRFRAPEDDSILGGRIDHVDIQYWTPVQTAQIRLMAPDDSTIETSETELTSRGFRASVEFEPLTQSGVYRVEHSELAADGDTQTGEFQFAYDPDSPDRLQSLIERDDGPNWLLLAGIGLLVVGGAAIVVPRRR